MKISKIEQNSSPIIPQASLSEMEMYNRIKEEIKNEIDICVPAKVISKNGSYVTVQPLPNIKTNTGSFIQRKPVTVRASEESYIRIGGFGYLISGDVPRIDKNGNLMYKSYDPMDGANHVFTNGFFLSESPKEYMFIRFGQSLRGNTKRYEYAFLGGKFPVVRPDNSHIEGHYRPILDHETCGLTYISDLYNIAENTFHKDEFTFDEDGYVYLSIIFQVMNWIYFDNNPPDDPGSYWDSPYLSLFAVPRYKIFDIAFNNNGWPVDIVYGNGTKVTKPPCSQWYRFMDVAYNPETQDAYICENLSDKMPRIFTCIGRPQS